MKFAQHDAANSFADGFVKASTFDEFVKASHSGVVHEMLIEPCADWWSDPNDLIPWNLISVIEQFKLNHGRFSCVVARKRHPIRLRKSGDEFIDEVVKDDSLAHTYVQWMSADLSRHWMNVSITCRTAVTTMTDKTVVVKSHDGQLISMYVRVIANGEYQWFQRMSRYNRPVPVPDDMIIASLIEPSRSVPASTTDWPRIAPDTLIFGSLRKKFDPEYSSRLRSDAADRHSPQTKATDAVNHHLKTLMNLYRRQRGLNMLVPLRFWPIFEKLRAMAASCEGLPPVCAERLAIINQMSDLLDTEIIKDAEAHKKNRMNA